MSDIAVQIVSYETKRYLPACLDSVIDGLMDSGIAFKILILENGSGEDLSDIEESYRGKPVVFYYSEKNLGFGAGHNFLTKKENGKYLFALNPDTVASKTAIKKLFDFMESHPEAGLCGPRVEESLGFWWRKWAFWPKLFVVKSLLKKYLRIEIARNAMALEFNPIIGSALFFRRKAFEEIGGFDEHLFLYFEEGDICNSLKMKKWKIFFVYDAMVTHFCKRNEARHAKIFRESKEYFHKKWPQGDIK